MRECIAESPSHGQTIMQYGPASAGASDYRALAAEIAAQHSAPAPARVEVSVNPSLRATLVAADLKSVKEPFS